MHIGGLERLPKKQELWYNVSGAEGTSALDMLFKRLRKMLQKIMSACSRCWFRVHVQSHKSALVMASGGCQTHNAMSAGCQICPSPDEALIWRLALFGTMIVPTDVSSPPAEPWQVLGISPDFSHSRMSERIKMAWNQLIKELIFQLPLSKGAPSSSLMRAAINRLVSSMHFVPMLSMCPLLLYREAWSFDTCHGWRVAGVV